MGDAFLRISNVLLSILLADVHHVTLDILFRMEIVLPVLETQTADLILSLVLVFNAQPLTLSLMEYALCQVLFAHRLIEMESV